MVDANNRIRCMPPGNTEQSLDLAWRIEIADDGGHPVARIYCAEIIAASALQVRH
jgi:hypothetical protein